MAEDEDTGAEGGGKAPGFSAEEFSDSKLEELLHVWIEFHRETAIRAGKREKEKLARRVAIHKQWRDELDSLLEGLQTTVSAARALSQSGGVDLIIEKLLSPAHEDPSESILQSRAFERAGDELAEFYRGFERFHEASIRARKKLSDRSGRPQERYRKNALIELAELYAAASGQMPGDTAQGPWPSFAQAAARLAWRRPGLLTGHIRSAAKTMQRRAQFEVEQKSNTGITSLLHSARATPWFVAYSRRSPPNTEAED